MDDVQAKPSRALPVAVAGGIAIAVFGILLAANGGKGKSTTGTVASNDTNTPAKPDDKPAATPTPPTPTADKPADTPADKPVATAASPDAVPAVAAVPDKPKTVTLTIAVRPADAKVTVDGKPVSGGKIDLPVSDTPVKVAASATGYESDEKSASVAKDGTVSLDLKKEVAAAPKEPKTPAGKTPPPATHPKTPKKPPKIEL